MRDDNYKDLQRDIRIIRDGMAEIQTSSKLTSMELGGIVKHLALINGKVQSHEKILNEYRLSNELSKQKYEDAVIHRAANCPQLGVIKELQEKALTGSAIKAFMARSLTIVTVVLGGVWTIFKIIEIVLANGG
jgi:hypothetical protein